MGLYLLNLVEIYRKEIVTANYIEIINVIAYTTVTKKTQINTY
jgi:hypothetical protein